MLEGLFVVWLATVPAQPARLDVPLGAFATAQLADVVTTRVALGRGLVEANPLMRPFASSTPKLVLAKVGTVLAVRWAAGQVARSSPKLARAMIWVLTGVTVGAVAWNVRVMRKVGRW